MPEFLLYILIFTPHLISFCLLGHHSFPDTTHLPTLFPQSGVPFLLLLEKAKPCSCFSTTSLMNLFPVSFWGMNHSLLWLTKHLTCIFPMAIVISFFAIHYSYLCSCLFLPLAGELLRVAKEHVLFNSHSPLSMAYVWHMVGAQSMCRMTLNYNG